MVNKVLSSLNNNQPLAWRYDIIFTNKGPRALSFCVVTNVDMWVFVKLSYGIILTVIVVGYISVPIRCIWSINNRGNIFNYIDWLALGIEGKGT